MPIHYRDYDPARDKEAVRRIWKEVGWLPEGKEELMDAFVESGRALVADADGTAECLVLTAPGTMRYLDEDLPLSVLTGVTTSRVVRKRGLARQLAARAVAADAEAGALVSALGMFEQGYYNRIGFGSGSYENRLAFDPASLTVTTRARIPRRLTKDDWQQMHQARLERLRVHGGCNLTPPQITRGEILSDSDGFGLGYADGPNGALSHYFWCTGGSKENGPYSVHWMVYRNREQFLELMALLKGLGDQVRLVSMHEPGHIQLQDLLEFPFRYRIASKGSCFQSIGRADAFWQMRICDLPACLQRTRLSGDAVRFNLKLSDPITAALPEGTRWRGVGGDYVITLGAASGAEPGAAPDLPTLAASVNAFTRLWLGVRPATALAFTDEIAGPPELLAALDRVLCLPPPKPDWDF